MNKIAIANYKGGVAKTQTAFELAFYLAKNNYKVLVFDTDPQANITDLLLAGSTPQGRMLPDILASGTSVWENDINTRTFENGCSVHFVASNMDLGRIEGRIVSDVPKEYIIADRTADIARNYDFIIYDMAPSAELLGISTLLSVDEVIIPTSLDRLSIEGTKKMVKMIQTIKSNNRLNPAINLRAILVTRFRRTLSTLFHGNELEKLYPDYVVKPYVRESTHVQQASNANKPIQEYDPDCNAAKDYVKAFQEIYPLINL